MSLTHGNLDKAPAQDCMYLTPVAKGAYAVYAKLGDEWVYLGSHAVEGDGGQGPRLPHEGWRPQPKHLRD